MKGIESIAPTEKNVKKSKFLKVHRILLRRWNSEALCEDGSRGKYEFCELTVDVRSALRKAFKRALWALRSVRGYRVYGYMFTFTIARKEDELKALEDFSRVWSAMSARIRRRTGARLLVVIHKKEGQKRKVPHIHVVVYVDRKLYSSRVPDWLKADLGLWKWGFTRVERVRKPIKYVLSYLKKGSLENLALDLQVLRSLPGRRKLWYVYVAPELRSPQYKVRFGLPGWVQRKLRERFKFFWDAVVDSFERVSGGWCLCFITGEKEFWRGEWKFCWSVTDYVEVGGS